MAVTFLPFALVRVAFRMVIDTVHKKQTPEPIYTCMYISFYLAIIVD